MNSRDESRLTQEKPRLDFVSAVEAAEAIRRKKVSSRELTGRAFERLDRYDPEINAFTYQVREEAMDRARECDEMVARGEATGPFHGVPVHVKESFGVAGRPCTWGIPAFKNSKAKWDSDPVSNLRNAGAVLMGATNVPLALADLQTYNPIYGTTNNPWDAARTPGGSSGGSAAALAAGIGYLSVGSDLGGSIRVPSHFTGIYGHKPTLDLVSQRGHLPGGHYADPGFTTLLSVSGPMARSAGDLLAALRVLGGPAAWDTKAWRWEMPEPRARTLKDFRVGYVLDDPIAPVFDDLKPALERTIRALEKAGAKLTSGWPSGYDPAALQKNNRIMASAFLFSVEPKQEQEKERMRSSPARPPGDVPFAEWQQQNLRRLAFRAQWQGYFENVDVFLTPVAFTGAFPHDHSEGARSIGGRSYWNLLGWIAAASLTGCPATVAPVGKTTSGLPVGVQIMGPFWEDATTITFAELLADEIGGFTAPPGFEI
jgi:amidase